jgi:hypothetical protein
MKLAGVMLALFKGVMDDVREGGREPAFSRQTQIICYQSLAVACFLSEAIGGASVILHSHSHRERERLRERLRD